MSSRLLVFLMVSMLILASVPTEAGLMDNHSKNVCMRELATFAVQRCGDRPLADNLPELFKYACANSVTIEELLEVVCPE